MTGTPPRSPGRPKTGQKSVRSFRPPDALWNEFLAVMAKDGRSHSDALIEALRDWVRKQQGKPPASPDG